MTLEPAEKAAAFAKRGTQVWSMTADKASGRISMTVLMKRLVSAGFLHVLIEGGAGVTGPALSEKLVDELVLFMAPKISGTEGLGWSGALGIDSMGRALQFELLHVEHVGADLMITARPTRRPS